MNGTKPLKTATSRNSCLPKTYSFGGFFLFNTVYIFFFEVRKILQNQFCCLLALPVTKCATRKRNPQGINNFLPEIKHIHT